jgi:hypothetical protein
MKTCLTVFLVLLIAGCSSEKKRELAEQELIRTDLAFSGMSAEAGMQAAFLEYCANQGVILREGTPPVVGKAAIALLLGSSDDTGFCLTWEPHFARVARCGELGYTYGVYTLRIRSTDKLQKGTYVSVWSLENGRWKWVLDTGNEGLGE